MFEIDKKKLLAKGPDLEEFVAGRKKRYTTYIFKEHSDRKKWLKRVAARRVRSAPPDCLYNHGDYKRLYDLWWTLW